MKRLLLSGLVLSLLSINNCSAIAKEQNIEAPKTKQVIKAVIKGDIELVENYINSGFSLNQQIKGKSILNYAIAAQQDKMLDFLLQNGANPSLNSETPALYFAVVEKNQYAIAKLLKAGADCNQMYQNLTAKDLATTYQEKDMLEIFNNYENNKTSFNPEEYRSTDKEFTKKSEIIDNKEGDNVLRAKVDYTLKKKDADLIKISKSKAVNEQSFKLKMQKDNTEYEKTRNKITKEQYQLYKILDKLLRANNLQYQNWRIGMDIDTKTINAYASSANLITINSALYDSLYPNIDAIAYVIAHELAHLILGHNQIAYENNLKIRQLEIMMQKSAYAASYQKGLGDINSALGNYSTAIGNSVSTIGYHIDIAKKNKEINKIFKQERMLEIQADTEALTLMTKAGFDAQKSKDTIDLFSNIPNVYTNRSTHPDNTTRLRNINATLAINDIPELKKQGQKELLNSKVSQLEKSSDNKSIILTKASGVKKTQYSPMSQDEKLIQKAYEYYKNDDLVNAKNFFISAYMYNPNNFIPTLYLSYIEEYNFKKTKNIKSLKEAKYWIRKAYRLSPYNSYVQTQHNDIKNFFLAIKEEKNKKN